MASPAEIKDLFSAPVAMMGFPGHDTRVPAEGESVEVTYRSGSISRASNFEFNVNVDAEDKQFVQHSLASFGGFSGSPIFLANGHVAVVNSSATVAEDRGIKSNLAYGIRIDALWELLAFHGLTDRVDIPVSDSTLRLARFSEPWVRNDNARRAIELTDDIDRFDWQSIEGVRSSINDLNKALDLAPTYPEAYFWRAAMYGYLANLIPNEKLRYLNLAIADCEKRIELAPSSIDAAMQYLWMLKRLSDVRNETLHPKIAEAATKLLESDLLRNYIEGQSEEWRRKDAQAEFLTGLYYLRAQTRNWVSEKGDIVSDLTEAIKYCDNMHVSLRSFYNYRGQVYKALGRLNEANADFKKAAGIP